MPTALDTTKALISLAEAKEYLKVTNTNDDLILNHLINDVSAWVANYLKRDLVSKEKTEYYSGDGCDELMLKRYPVVSIASIKVDSDRTFGDSSLVDSDDYIVKKDRGIIKAFNLFGSWTSGDSNIQVVYTAGFTVGTDAGSGTMPYEIRLAMKRILDFQHRIGYTHRKADYQSESISGMNVTFKDSAIPKDALKMLDGWRATPSPQYQYAD